MFKLIIGFTALFSMSAFASGLSPMEIRDAQDTLACAASPARLALHEAKRLNADYKKCDSFECAKLASAAVQNQMCEAAKSCEEIAHVMLYPCYQRIILTEMNYDASSFLKKLIRRALRKL